MDTQFKKGILDICVLSVLSREEMYGYGLKIEMSKIMDVNENTLYPLLRRLEKDGLLDTSSHLSDQGRVRKYYNITEEGKTRLIEMKQEWTGFKEVVDTMLFSTNQADTTFSEVENEA